MASMIMLLNRLIVCETTSKWAVALRRQLSCHAGIRLSETRNLDDCWQQAVASPGCFVALAATTVNLEPLVAAIKRLREKLPHVCVAVLAQRSLAEAEWILREAGAVHVVFSSRDLGPLIRLANRHFDRRQAELPQDTRGWEQLPWGGVWEPASAAQAAWLRQPPGE